MHHKAVISYGTAAQAGKPINVQCVCGTGGDFGSAFDATNYISGHFRGLGGVCTWELQDMTVVNTPDVPVDDPQPITTDANEGNGG